MLTIELLQNEEILDLVQEYKGDKSKEKRNKAICALYNANKLIGEIAKILSIGRHTVTRVLKEYGIYVKAKSINHLNAEKIIRNEKIIKLYKEGLSFRKIADKLDVGHSTAEYVVHMFISKKLPQYSIVVPKKENLIRHRKYHFDIDFFSKIDSEEKAYWLGFLYADGCITKTAVRLEIQRNDIGHLEKFRNAVKAFDTKLKLKDDGDIHSCMLYLSSVKMVNDLIQKGCFQRKTFSLRFPKSEQVPPSLINHFMRGYFDGDGCICIRKKITGTNLFGIVGCKEFVQSYKNVLFDAINKKNDVKLLDTIGDKRIKSLQLGGNRQIAKIYDFLYNNATVFLDRKKEKFEMIKRPS